MIPIARKLEQAGISYWLDEAEIRWGDKISSRISEGLANSNFVIVFLTPAFLGRNWTETELSAALTRENDEGRTVVLPIVTGDPHVLLARYPLLRDKKYLEWNGSPDFIVTELQSLILHTRKNSNQDISYNDALTGILNRNWIYEHLPKKIEEAKERDAVLALVIVSLDNFKRVNDLFGHQIGDKTLIEAAERLVLSVDNTASVARFSGDEFLVLTEIHSIEQLEIMAERIRQSFLTPMMINGQQLQVTATIGISLYPKDGVDTHELLRTADIAVYRAKQTHRGSYLIYDVSLDVHGDVWD